MKTSGTVGEIAAALAAVQTEMPSVKKGAVNPFFKSHYADLSDVLSVALPILGKHGLSLTQHPECPNGNHILTTRILHSSGEWIESEMPLFVPKPDAQSYGSSVTYGKRYAACAVLGIATEDDDGNAATHYDEPVHRTSGVVEGSYTDKQSKGLTEATEAQWKFIAKLTDQDVESAQSQYGPMNTAAASQLIDALKGDSAA